MATITFETYFCKPNSVQFYEVEHSSYSASQFDCLSYEESRMQWQTAKPYEQKYTFDDTLTIMAHVQANNPGGGADAFPVIELWDINGNFVATFGGGQQVGSQQNPNNIIYPNGSLVGIPMDSYLWEFTFDDFLTPATDSGCYYLRFYNLGSDSTTFLLYHSEPILVFDDVPNTIVVSGQNLTNRDAQKILINGWPGDFNPTFNVRIPGYVNLYKPKGIYISYLQQQYLSQQLSSQNVRTFTLQVGGSPTEGVPDYIIEKVAEIVIMDNFTVNNGTTITPYVYDADGDTGLKFIGSKSDPEASQLCWDKYTIKEKYATQNAFYRVVTTP